MVLKSALATAFCTGLLILGSPALADEYRAGEFLPDHDATDHAEPKSAEFSWNVQSPDTQILGALCQFFTPLRLELIADAGFPFKRNQFRVDKTPEIAF